MTWVEVFRRYIGSKLELLTIAERCSLKGWPDRTEALRNAFRLQQLYCEQELMRAEHIAATFKTFDGLRGPPTTLKAVDAIVHENWTDAREMALRQTLDEVAPRGGPRGTVPIPGGSSLRSAAWPARDRIAACGG